MGLFDRLKRKPKAEVNPFTGEAVPVHVVTQEELRRFEVVEVPREDRIDVGLRWLMRAVAIITTAFNFLMLLGYVTAFNIPYAAIFFFSTYFSLIYLKRRRPVDPIDGR